jgi:hypothetical protein
LIIAGLLGAKWQQGYISGPLDSDGELPLMLGAVTGNPARQNLAPFGDKLS